MFSVRKRDVCYLQRKREMYVIVYFNATTVPLSMYLSFTICRSFLWESQARANETSEEMTYKDVKKKLVNVRPGLLHWNYLRECSFKIFLLAWEMSKECEEVHIRFWFWFWVQYVLRAGGFEAHLCPESFVLVHLAYVASGSNACLMVSLTADSWFSARPRYTSRCWRWEVIMQHVYTGVNFICASWLVFGWTEDENN